jgi:hypothetical protein
LVLLAKYYQGSSSVALTSMEWKRNAYTLLVLKEGSERRRNLEDSDVDGIILSGS